MKKYLIVIFAVLLVLCFVSCSSSPTAIKVGGSRVDASEYAYYLNYNRMNLDELLSGTTVLNADELLTQARAQAREHIVTAEIVRIKCKELGLELSKEQKQAMEEEKDALIDSFGGLSGYLDYLRENALTDRLYDKLQENNYYYSMLYDYLSQGEDAVTTDQQLRQFYMENYIKLRYIRLSALDEEGNPLDEEALDELQEKAEDIKSKLTSGELTFDDAVAQFNDDPVMTDNPSGLTLGSQDASTAEYYEDAFNLNEGQVSSVKAYSDGYYILQRQAPEISYFESNREQIEVAASDWAFNSFIASARENISVSENSVCKEIDFNNLMDYVK